MSFLAHAFRSSPENPSTNLSDPAAWLFDAFGAQEDIAGVRVTERKALGSTPVFSAIRILAESVASLPLPVFKRRDGRGKDKAPTHPLYTILHDRANPEMTAFTFREVLQGHLAGWGNAYAEIEYRNNGQIAALWPLPPDKTRPVRHNGVRFFVTSVGGHEVSLPSENVLHIPGLGFDGLRGYSPISLCRRAVGLTMATEEFGSRYFGQGARASGILEHPGVLKEDAAKRLRESFEALHGGLSNAQRTAVLEEGMKWVQTTIPPEDSQFLETRGFQVLEVARIFRVPPHMLAHLADATFSNVESMGIEFVVHSLRPWLVRWEQALNWSLFNKQERGIFFAEFVANALLRGDTKSRFESYHLARQDGWLSTNDIRDLENLNPLPDGDGGDVYLQPLNMVPAGTPVQTNKRGKILDAATVLIGDAVGRLHGREVRSFERAAKRGEIDTWAASYYPGHQALLVRALVPALTALAGIMEADLADNAIEQHAASLAAAMVAESREGLDDGLSALSDESVRQYAATAIAALGA